MYLFFPYSSAEKSIWEKKRLKKQIDLKKKFFLKKQIYFPLLEQSGVGIGEVSFAHSSGL